MCLFEVTCISFSKLKELRVIMNNVWISFIWVEEWQSKCKEDHHSYTCTCKAATYYALGERKPEKIQACQDSNPDLCDTN